MILHARTLSALAMVIGLWISGCQSYTRMARPDYSLEEPALASAVGTSMLDSSWQLMDVTSRPGTDGRNSLTKAPGRPLFRAVIEDTQDTLWLSNRQVPLAGVLNTRDLGGIRTADGRQLRWGLIYRSGHLHKLSRKGERQLNDLGMKTIVDLRTAGEVEEKPDRLPKKLAYHPIPIGGITHEDLERTEKEIREQTPEQFDGAGKMKLVMEKFALEGAEDFAKIFDLLLEQDSYPLLYHCTAGKDRTGLLTALILSAVGVPREVIFDEYLLSNYYRYDRIERNARLGAWIMGIDPASSRPMMNVEEDYLLSSFEAIEREYGSVDSYLATALGVKTIDIEKLRDLLLY